MNRLKELRLNANLSQAALANAAGTTQRNISYWESGTVELNLNAAIRLAQILQVEYLAGYSDDLGIKPDIDLPTSGYSPEIRKLIEDYQKLNSRSKKYLQDTMKILLDTSGSEQKKKGN